MKRENMKVSGIGEQTSRVTRARAAAHQSYVGSEVPKENINTRVLRKNSKRTAFEERNNNVTVTASLQNKRRAVLKDVTNICSDNSYRNCITTAKNPKNNSKQGKKNAIYMSKKADLVTVKSQLVPVSLQPRNCNEKGMAQTRSSGVNLDKNIGLRKVSFVLEGENNENATQIESHLQSISKTGKRSFHEKFAITTKPDYSDIDSDEKNPQMCSLYAPEIYSNLRAAELVHRPHFDFMEKVQRDVTQSMRGVLVDWLVEVSEEYKLVADTLYLTVYLVDLYLSRHHIERKILQLLGITCMLIASKYEEICAPRIEELCFITDSTYTKSEVLKMEIQVLNYLNFQLSAPTTKTFLRRFLRAAQASHERPNVEMEFLANYLAELTMIDYNFLTFVPSMVAASAIFLARWTLDQSSHPWNDTLGHYTSYKPFDLKTAVFALHGLQSNGGNCPLNAIRVKYNQEKFKGVASLAAPELSETLF